MPTGLLRSAIGFAAAVLVLTAVRVPCALAQTASSTQLTLADYGLGNGATVTGTNPRFDLYVPDYSSARRLHVAFKVQFSSIVADGGSITVRVDGSPIGTTTVGALRKGGTAGGVFEHFKGRGRVLDVSIEGQLGIRTGPCKSYDPNAFWMRVERGTTLTVEHTDAPPKTPPEFFQNYDGAYAVLPAPGAPDEVRRSALALAYWIHQFQRWRRVRLSYDSVPAGPVRKIVVGESGEGGDLAVRDGVLYTTPRGVDLLLVQAALRVAAKERNDSVSLKNVALRSPATLDAMGVGTRTQRGAGDLSFAVPFALSVFGGLPYGLHAHLDLAHGSFDRADRAAVTVLLNGAVVNGFGLSSQGGTQHFDVPIDEHRLGPTNTLTATVEYAPHGCQNVTLTVSLLGSSRLVWDGVAGYPPTIGEFFSEAAGKLGVAVSQPELYPYAFLLLDRLGSIDPNVSNVDVERYAGTLSGYDDAAYVAAPADIKEMPLAWDPATGNLRLTDDAGKTVFAAQVGAAYGQFRSFRAAVPTLILTYTKTGDPQILNGLANLTPSQLGGARSDLLLFDAKHVVYESPANVVTAQRSPRSALFTSWPLIAGFGVVVVVALFFIARRARKVS